MDVLLNFISEDLIYALGWTVMHSIWQGFLIAIIMAFAFQVLRKKSAKVRYEIATISLFMVLVSAVSTFIWYFGSAGEIIEQQMTLSGQTVVGEQLSDTTILQSFRESCIAYFNNHLPMIVLIWMVGAGFFILRLFGGLIYIQRLKHQKITLLSPYWQSKVQSIAAKIPNKKVVQIFESASVKVPMVIGHLKPYILLPIGAINQLDEKEVEAIIAHELGHVFRNDFLLNIVLSFIEVFFYYHPAVWWISGNIRLERENCCDDIAIKICGDSLIYAKALVRLQEINTYAPTFAMPFSGQKNQLLNRIKRILNQPQSRSNIVERMAATCFLLLAIVFMSVSPNRMDAEVEEPMLIVEGVENLSSNDFVELEAVVQDTVPDEKRVLRGEKLEITRKDGEITKIVLDGKVIPKEEYESYDYIETEGGITVKGDDVPKLFADTISWGSVFEKANSQVWFDSLSPDPQRELPNAFKERFASSKSQQTITKQKNGEGQTVIILEREGQDPVEIVVDEEEDIIIVEGNELEDGDTAIILEENSSPFALRQMRFNSPDYEFFQEFEIEEDAKNQFLKEYKEGKYFFFDNNKNVFEDTIPWKDRKIIREKRTAELQAHLEAKKNQLFDHRATERGIVQKRLELFEQADEMTNEEREKVLKHLLARVERNEKSLIEKDERLKKRHDRLNKKSRESHEERKLFHERNMQERLELLNHRSSNNVASKIASELKRDGLIEDKADFSFSLSEKRLRVDGKKQPKIILEKYKKLYKEITGNEVNEKSSFQINISSN